MRGGERETLKGGKRGGNMRGRWEDKIGEKVESKGRYGRREEGGEKKMIMGER